MKRLQPAACLQILCEIEQVNAQNHEPSSESHLNFKHRPVAPVPPLCSVCRFQSRHNQTLWSCSRFQTSSKLPTSLIPKFCLPVTGKLCDHLRTHLERCRKECLVSCICPHGRHRYRCKECRGTGICPHGKERHVCHPCGGKSVCPHGRHRYRCTECRGKGICEHGRRKNACRDCGTAQLPASTNPDVVAAPSQDGQQGLAVAQPQHLAVS